MSVKTMRSAFLFALFALFLQVANAQDKTITGKVTDSKDGSPVVGASVQAKGSRTGASTKGDGTFSIVAGPSVTALIISSVGYETQEVSIVGVSAINISLTTTTGANLNEVVVVGYGTARKKDLTGSIVSVKAKDFNMGPSTNPDQLLIGKVAGLQIINTSGQPGAATIVKIRGNNSIRSGNTPLYVIDGVPLDGRSARPSYNASGVGQTPDVNPLIFINPADISTIDILKDASASAIYGSRGANGVVLITTKKGQLGPAKIEAGVTAGFGGVMRKIKVLDANGYRNALKSYNAPLSDSGANINPFKEIIRSGAPTQNYTVAFGGGTDNGKYRASFLYADQQGIVRKSGLKKFVGNFNGQYKFLDKRLSVDFNATAANVQERIAPVSNDAGSNGNIISLALIWNPTLSLTRKDGLYNQANPSGQVNPLALSDAYNDRTSITTVLASVATGYKFTPELEYRMLVGINYSTGIRKGEIQGWINGTGGNADNKGVAAVLNNQLLSKLINHTLNFNKKVSNDLSLSALVGYEYWSTSYQGNGASTYNFGLNLQQNNITPHYHYYDNLQAGAQANYVAFGFKDPSVELQSYFARAVFNYRDKYLLTATFRTDGSSKFGKNNKYAYFPSVAAAWTISNEDFMQNNTLFDLLKLRIGYGQTGNQEFNPVDAALDVAAYNGPTSLNVVHYGNPDLRWETVSSIDIGLDFSVLKNRVTFVVDYFSKKTVNPIVDFVISQPSASGTIYKNMDGKTHPTVGYTPKAWITNKGFEFTIDGFIVQKKDLVWNAQLNMTFVKNKFLCPELGSLTFVKNTGGLHGQGSSGAYSEVIAHGQPLDVFWLPQFQGFDKTSGIGQYSVAPVFSGDPNPTTYLGFSTSVTYKKLTFGINAHGSFGNKIFNNTAMSVLNINNIVGGRNIREGLVGNGESTSNFITPSTRFLEKGDYIKLGNATLTYNIGDLGKSIKNANIYISGNNVFVISKYTGFDPEVNVDKTLNGIPSLGIDYIGYPAARTILVGINFSL